MTKQNLTTVRECKYCGAQLSGGQDMHNNQYLTFSWLLASEIHEMQHVKRGVRQGNQKIPQSHITTTTSFMKPNTMMADD